MCSIKIQTENSRGNTNAPLPIGKASALQALMGVHKKASNNSYLKYKFLLTKEIKASLPTAVGVINRMGLMHQPL